MKSMIRHIDSHGIKYDALAFICPGCKSEFGSGLHMLPVNTDKTSPAWSWDGNLEAPTLSPSILTHASGKQPQCHSFLRNGIFEFLSDCTHPLAGQHVPIPDLPDWFTEPVEEVKMTDENTTEETKSIQDRALDLLEGLEDQLSILQADAKAAINQLLIDAGRRVVEVLEDSAESLDDALDEKESAFSLPTQ